MHLTAVTSKTIAARYYDRPVAYSYWDGCSTGGRQALMEAQRFPGDFDGIVAGAPVLNFVDTLILGLWHARALEPAPVTLETLKIVADAVYAKCDGLDGLVDGIIDDPRRCPFDPVKDLPVCAADASSAGCVTDGTGGRAEEDVQRRREQRRAVLPGPAGRRREGRHPALRLAAGGQRLGSMARGVRPGRSRCSWPFPSRS